MTAQVGRPGNASGELFRSKNPLKPARSNKRLEGQTQ
jgi:hypothetical protein